MRCPVGVWPGANRPDAFFQIENQSVSGVAVEIVSMEPFAAEEAQAFIQFYRGRVRDFGFEDDLPHVDVSKGALYSS